LSVPGLSLEALDLACVRGEKRVFAGLSFSASVGEALEIVGPNGSGKSSLLRIAAGFLPAAAGRLELKRDGAVDPDRQTSVHLISHLDGLKAAMSAGETIAFYAGLFGRKAAVDDSLTQVGLERQRDLPVQFLSAGQRRRLALARLLIAPRPIWLLDEPLASLDSKGRELVVSLITMHLAGGGIALAATHDPILPGVRRISLGAAA
jgi:heme exporter protein A